ncbi:unnamed protein product [Closterium sp. NIES-53]
MYIAWTAPPARLPTTASDAAMRPFADQPTANHPAAAALPLAASSAKARRDESTARQCSVSPVDPSAADHANPSSADAAQPVAAVLAAADPASAVVAAAAPAVAVVAPTPVLPVLVLLPSRLTLPRRNVLPEVQIVCAMVRLLDTTP